MNRQKQQLLKWLLRVYTTIVLLCTPVLLLAQDDDLPCDGDDPYSNCPLDTWVTLLALIVAGFAVCHLYNRAKNQQLLLHREER